MLPSPSFFCKFQRIPLQNCDSRLLFFRFFLLGKCRIKKHLDGKSPIFPRDIRFFSVIFPDSTEILSVVTGFLLLLQQAGKRDFPPAVIGHINAVKQLSGDFKPLLMVE